MNAPRFRRVLPGQIWRLQRTTGDGKFLHPVVTGQIDEVTPETVMVRWLPDGAIQVPDNASPIRIPRDQFRFLERVP